jgi:hypothetical protein
LVVPFAEDRVPAEGLQMYPDVQFIPRGVGVKAPAGYDAAFEGIVLVVSSTQASFWAAMRLAGESGRLAGYGRLLAQSPPPPQARFGT